MCRHALPRFNFPVAQTLHDVGHIVVAHPVSSAASILLPVSALVLIAALHRLRPSVGAGRPWRRTRLAGRTSGLVLGRIGPAHTN